MSNTRIVYIIQLIDYIKSVKYTKYGFITIAIVFALLVLSFITIPDSTLASTDPVRWNAFELPGEGISGGWVLAEGSDIEVLASSSDGRLYAGVTGLPYTLYTSTNYGLTWSATGKVTDDIVSIATSPGNPGTIYYATSDSVYRSVDGGEHFLKLPPSPGNAGSGNIVITSLAVSHTTADIIAVGTRDTDSSEYGGVYILDETVPSYIWGDSGIGSFDVYSLAFSPNYPADGQLIAVTSDGSDAYVTVKPGIAAWGSFVGDVRLSQNNGIPHTPVIPVVSATISIPDNYGKDFSLQNSIFYVAISTGIGFGDVYKINSMMNPGPSIATDLNIGSKSGYDNLDISALTCSGAYPLVHLIAGTANDNRIYLSSDGGINWEESLKSPTGDTVSGILASNDFATSQTAFVATRGNDSAFSITRDGGYTCNQLSLIDNRIDSIVDIAPSPDYISDKTLFAITWGNRHSLWRTETGGATWERILSGTLEGNEILTRVGLPPQSRISQKTLFLTGESEGEPAIWESADNGQSYFVRKTTDPDTGMTFPIDAWAIADETTLFLGSFNGVASRIFKTTSSGFFFFGGVEVGNQPLNTLVLSPDYEIDGTIAAGNNIGWVYWSDDGGDSFQPLPYEAISPPLSGQVAITFDTDYSNTRTLYAACSTADAGIFRFTIDDTSWESIDDNPPLDASINSIILSDNGVLYAVNSNSDGGMQRCLDPVSLSNPLFETVTSGLNLGATLHGLWQSGDRILSIDTTNNMLMTYRDTLAKPVILVSPGNEDTDIGDLIDNIVKNISLDWETLAGATVYEWRCDSDSDLRSVPDGFEATVQASKVKLPSLEPDTIYYWQVRTISPVVSPWSAKWSFTTVNDTAFSGIELQSPAPGATGVPIQPLFQWESVSEEDAYEFVLGKNPDFSDPVIVKENQNALTSNAWQCEIDLDYDTAYFWKVRDVNGSSVGPWSSVSSFITEAEPADIPGTVAELTLPADETPDQSSDLKISDITPGGTPPVQNSLPPVAAPESSFPGWVIYVISSQAALIVITLIIILILVARRRQL